MEIPELYFERDTDWYDWLLNNHENHEAVYLIFYKLEMNIPTMRWEQAVRAALCFGWIDSKVQSLGNGKRRQYFCPRKPKSVWSAVNKKHIDELLKLNLMQKGGLKTIEIAKQNGQWTDLDNVENGIIPNDLQAAFNKSPDAYKNYQAFAKGYRKHYLFWLHSAKRDETRKKRINQIIELCANNIKSRDAR